MNAGGDSVIPPRDAAADGLCVIAPRQPGQVRRRRRPVTGFMLNLTPLLDCVFLLLMFLIVATRFSTPEGLLPAKLPARAGAAGATASGFEVPRTPIRIFVTASNAGTALVRIGGPDVDAVAPENVPPQLAALRQRPGYDERTPVYLLPDDSVKWDDVVNVYNAALAASFQRIYFVRP